MSPGSQNKKNPTEDNTDNSEKVDLHFDQFNQNVLEEHNL